MGRTLPIRCDCGAVRGQARDLSPETGNRVVCYCSDCQAFAFASGHAERILDTNGGTDLFQLSPARIVFDAGAEKLACLRFSPKGVLRWTASCCGAPIANLSPNPGIPICGFFVTALDADPQTREAALGPVRYRVQAAEARGEAPPGSHARFPLSMLFRLMPRLLAARLRGDHARSPFFDPQSRAPIVTPRIVGDDERARITAAREAWLEGAAPGRS